jgi:hypothetical protein
MEVIAVEAATPTAVRSAGGALTTAAALAVLDEDQPTFVRLNTSVERSQNMVGREWHLPPLSETRPPSTTAHLKKAKSGLAPQS